MDRISDYNDLRNVIEVGGLIDTASDGEQLSLSACDVYSMVKHFDNWFVVNMDV